LAGGFVVRLGVGRVVAVVGVPDGLSACPVSAAAEDGGGVVADRPSSSAAEEASRCEVCQ
jgi:hypothetical protein